MVEQHDVDPVRRPARRSTRSRTSTYPGCRGPNHADFSANGRFFMVISCEFSGALLKIDAQPRSAAIQVDSQPAPRWTR